MCVCVGGVGVGVLVGGVDGWGQGDGLERRGEILIMRDTSSSSEEP